MQLKKGLLKLFFFSQQVKKSPNRKIQRSAKVNKEVQELDIEIHNEPPKPPTRGRAARTTKRTGNVNQPPKPESQRATKGKESVEALYVTETNRTRAARTRSNTNSTHKQNKAKPSPKSNSKRGTKASVNQTKKENSQEEPIRSNRPRRAKVEISSTVSQRTTRARKRKVDNQTVEDRPVEAESKPKRTRNTEKQGVSAENKASKPKGKQTKLTRRTSLAVGKKTPKMSPAKSKTRSEVDRGTKSDSPKKRGGRSANKNVIAEVPANKRNRKTAKKPEEKTQKSPPLETVPKRGRGARAKVSQPPAEEVTKPPGKKGQETATGTKARKGRKRKLEDEQLAGPAKVAKSETKVARGGKTAAARRGPRAANASTAKDKKREDEEIVEAKSTRARTSAKAAKETAKGEPRATVKGNKVGSITIRRGRGASSSGRTDESVVGRPRRRAARAPPPLLPSARPAPSRQDARGARAAAADSSGPRRAAPSALEYKLFKR